MEALIYTTKGNLPIDSLQYAVEWDVQESYVKLTERYTLAGEVVRESAHVYDTKGISVSGIAASI